MRFYINTPYILQYNARDFFFWFGNKNKLRLLRVGLAVGFVRSGAAAEIRWNPNDISASRT